MSLLLADLPEIIGHGFRPIEILDLDLLTTPYALSHRRLSVFSHKGMKCANPDCDRVGKHLIKTVAGKKQLSVHIDVYTEDFTLMTVDHIQPRSKGGSDELANKQPMCTYCNGAKADKVI